ncbi:MAG: TonB family protein [Kordiimonadaceae bacterium]|nr:TonB family protein [Kordiimonadaceae bacterium]
MFKNLNKIFVALSLAVAFSIVAAPAHAIDMNGWKKAVIKKVAKKQKYPRSALAREIEGKARVRLTVAADGAITSHEILQETGQSVLDKEIPKLVKRLNPLPALPDGKTELSFVLPLNWSLN